MPMPNKGISTKFKHRGSGDRERALETAYLCASPALDQPSRRTKEFLKDHKPVLLTRDLLSFSSKRDSVSSHKQHGFRVSSPSSVHRTLDDKRSAEPKFHVPKSTFAIGQRRSSCKIELAVGSQISRTSQNTGKSMAAARVIPNYTDIAILPRNANSRPMTSKPTGAPCSVTL